MSIKQALSAVIMTSVFGAGMAVLPASAQFAKTEDAIKYRQSAMFIMSQHFGHIGAAVQGKVPFDAKAVAADADVLATLSKLPWAGFGPGTEGGKAQPEVWTENAKFQAAAEKLQSEMAKLDEAAKTGDLAQVKAAFGATADSCKACHQDFRKR